MTHHLLNRVGERTGSEWRGPLPDEGLNEKATCGDAHAIKRAARARRRPPRVRDASTCSDGTVWEEAAIH